MPESSFELERGDGILVGHAGGKGVPALLLHGGPGLPDYTEGCAAELADLFTTIRYTQRGTLPSTTGGPYTVESHMEDALAVLDGYELEKAWAIGHSWGGHLALHLAVAHPERLFGVVCIGTLGASNDVFPEFRENLRRNLTVEELARVEEIDEHEEAGALSEQESLEQFRIVWPNYFAHPAKAARFEFEHLGVECNKDTFASVTEHFEAGTLRKGLRRVKLPALFVHGVQDPLPLRGALETAKLIRGAKVARAPDCGHFPWHEQPGFTNRLLRGLIAQL